MLDYLFEKAGATTHSFILEVDGLPIGRFTSVSGLTMEVEIETYAEGGENGFEHKLPGRVKWPNLVFKRGITHDNNLLNWFETSVGPGFAVMPKVSRASCAVTMLSSTGKRLRAWNIVDAFPVRWQGPDFDAAVDEVPVEELEIAHHGFISATFL